MGWPKEVRNLIRYNHLAYLMILTREIGNDRRRPRTLDGLK
jgi:hypothetical protein